MALNNLAFAELNDTTVLQQLTTANLALTASVATLTTSNKKLAEVLAKKQRLQRQRVVGGHVQQTRLSQVIIAGHTGSQPTPHECNLWEQGCKAQGQCNECQHEEKVGCDDCKQQLRNDEQR
jgi:septal ring factor EnvC (AmiA/AmiB activator)